MSIRRIFTYKEDALNEVSKKVEKFDEKLWELLEDMKDTLKDSQGVGIAAPQIGILKRVLIAKINGEDIEIINPEITEEFGQQNSTEGCLSCPGFTGVIVRPKCVCVNFSNRFGEENSIKVKKLNAAIVCHEIDHLNGITIRTKK